MGLDIDLCKLTKQENVSFDCKEFMDKFDNYFNLGSKFIYEKVLKLLKTKTLEEIFSENNEFLYKHNYFDVEYFSLGCFNFINHIKKLEEKTGNKYLTEVKTDVFDVGNLLFKLFFEKFGDVFFVRKIMDKLYFYGYGVESLDFTLDFDGFNKQEIQSIFNFLKDLKQSKILIEFQQHDGSFKINFLDNYIYKNSDIYIETRYYVCYEELGYQRKGFLDDLSFFKNYLGDCWYIIKGTKPNKEINQYMPFCYNNEHLNEIKTSFEKDTPIQKWYLKEEDEFIWFSA